MHVFVFLNEWSYHCAVQAVKVLGGALHNMYTQPISNRSVNAMITIYQKVCFNKSFRKSAKADCLGSVNKSFRISAKAECLGSVYQGNQGRISKSLITTKIYRFSCFFPQVCKPFLKTHNGNLVKYGRDLLRVQEGTICFKLTLTQYQTNSVSRELMSERKKNLNEHKKITPKWHCQVTIDDSFLNLLQTPSFYDNL